jgi:RNA polymerase-associated protein
MVSLTNRRSVMTLFSGQCDPYSHQIRLVLAVKGVPADIVEVEPETKPEDLLDLNPYGTLPTLVDRDLVLYQPDVIMEFLDERFPHPPLLPVYPVARANSRTVTHRMRQDWYEHYETINLATNKEDVTKARKQLSESLLASASLFNKKPFFMSDEFSLLDCYLAPLLWRLPSLEISLPESADVIYDYAERIFKIPAFQSSLTELERELR